MDKIKIKNTENIKESQKKIKGAKEKKEASVLKNICDLLKKTPECFYHKVHGGMYGTTGIPDVLACYKGIYLALEVKRPIGGKISKIQESNIRKINDAGGYAIVVTSAVEVKEHLKTIDNYLDGLYDN